MHNIKSVLVIGSGPIVIGQACEFDYSGTQALNILKKEGIRVILINSNPATIMTDPAYSDATYIEPINTQTLEKIIDIERPEAILPTLGGQTALNAALDLYYEGILDKYGVKLIGADANAIEKGENREIFKDIVLKSGGDVAKSRLVSSFKEGLQAAEEIGFPLILRPSFTLGGLGSSFSENKDDYEIKLKRALEASPTSEVLIEESIFGWKEYELEVMADKAGNIVIVCSIENIDPTGVHTGDSITVAPALTLTDRQYQHLRDLSKKIIKEVGVKTGGCNIQFAIHPNTGRVVVIEMNPRVSRSSALASKATGFPIAKIATKVALGYTLDEIPNDITKKTPASFEPSIDYIALKIPKFDFAKFKNADTTLTTTMKSVGEIMSLGSSFSAALLKGVRSIGENDYAFKFKDIDLEKEKLLKLIKTPTPKRILYIQQALYLGADMDEVYNITKIDKWFLYEINKINDFAKYMLITPLDEVLLKEAKKIGFSDKDIAIIYNKREEDIRDMRHKAGIHPVYKCVDTCAGEFESYTPYYYSSYENQSDIKSGNNKEKIVILGSGPNKIGQGIEFDYSCVNAAFALKKEGYEVIIINCNPETVSTDYDTSDQLFFEPLTAEDVSEAILALGKIKGVIVSLGGQIPLSIAKDLSDMGINILGSGPREIANAEDRGIFSQILEKASLLAPKNMSVFGIEEALSAAKDIAYPILVRPSFVLGGQSMRVIYSEKELIDYFNALKPGQIAPGKPLLIDKFLEDAIEIDVDALYDGSQTFIGAIAEHIEQAGIHSGDSCSVIPAVNLGSSAIENIKEATHKLASLLNAKGLINIQFAIAGGVLYVLEANPRASRSVPFASKALSTPLAASAALISAGLSIKELQKRGILQESDNAYITGRPICVKESVFPFNRFISKDGGFVDTLLGPEMKSTGEVMGIAKTFPLAFKKAQIASGMSMKYKGIVFISIKDEDKRNIILASKILISLGYKILATKSTAKVLRLNGIDAQTVDKISADNQSSILPYMQKGEVAFVLNTPTGNKSVSDGEAIRKASLAMNIPIFTTINAFNAFVMGLGENEADAEIFPLQAFSSK